MATLLPESNEKFISDEVKGKRASFDNDNENETKVKMSCLLFVALNLLLAVLLCLTISYMIKDSITEIVQDVKLCVNCSDLVVHPDDGLDGVSARDDGICCVEDGQDIYDMVHMFAGRWMKKNLAEHNPKYSKYKCGTENENEIATIKVVGKGVRQEHNHHRKLLWDSDSELAIVPDVKHMTHHHEHGFIEIKKPGLYFVYSQLVLEHAGPGTVADFKEGPATYQHSIHVTQSSQSSARSILSNRDTRCSSTRDKYRFTSHIGSAFQLREGDRLFVKVNDVTEVVPDPHMNHFGVHRL